MDCDTVTFALMIQHRGDAVYRRLALSLADLVTIRGCLESDLALPQTADIGDRERIRRLASLTDAAITDIREKEGVKAQAGDPRYAPPRQEGGDGQSEGLGVDPSGA